jgi:hypothetical protein
MLMLIITRPQDAVGFDNTLVGAAQVHGNVMRYKAL